MTSRLDRLFILLETGTNAVTKRAAAQQLGEAQRLHPHDLHHLLARVSTLLKSTQWDTRISAAHAVQAILKQVPPWSPDPIKSDLFMDTIEEKQQLEAKQSTNAINKLTLEDFDMVKVLAQSSYLTGSEGSEYDVIADGEQINTEHQDENILTAKLGLNPRFMGIDTTDLFTSEDLAPTVVASKSTNTKVSVGETLKLSEGLSRREINRARRKARQSVSKQRSHDPDDVQEHGNSTNAQSSGSNTWELQSKKFKLEEPTLPEMSVSSPTEIGLAVPDVTGCWPDTVVDWPLEPFAKSLCQDLFSQKWEVRHGAATALRELLNLHGKGAGKSKDQNEKEMKEAHYQWIIDAALRLLCVLGLDRFGDFVSDQVVAPVRETCAQALGSLLLLLPTDKSHEGVNKGITGILSVMLKLLEHDEWEARHGALLALKYLLAVRTDLLDEILPKVFPATMKGLSDPVDDVGAAAASALIPVASALPRLLEPPQLEAVVARLWELLREQDDLAAACNSFMGLLAAILSLPAARACLKPQPFSQVLPRLWPFLSHSSSSVRKATLQTLQTLIGDNSDNENKKDKWGEGGGLVLQEALRHVFQRVLIEHVYAIQEVAERVWENLVIYSDLELLLHAACPLVSTWLCLAMQPEHVPFNPNLLITFATLNKQAKSNQSIGNGESQLNVYNGENSNLSGKSLSELKTYIGGIETVARNIRQNNVVQARCRAARMLGLLSHYIVQPAPGVIYTPDIPSPSLCYAKVLLAHLNSRSALQRTLVGLTMSHWATVDKSNPPVIPDILRDRLLGCLNECVYYDEIAATFTRLLHESRDYVATLKHYKLPVPVEITATGIMTLEQIAALAGKSIPGLCVTTGTTTTGHSSTANNVTVKLKPKLAETLEERRRALEFGASTTAAQQLSLNITSMAALAGAATMLHCLPESPQPLNPLVKPLMESIKREENEELQKLAAIHLSHLVDLCVDRIPTPNAKISMNLCTFLCSDAEFTPRLSKTDTDLYDGILTLNKRQRNAERLAYRGAGNSMGGGRGPGRPPNTDIPLEELLACEEPEAKAARTRRRGATLALTAIADQFGPNLSKRLPQLWELILPKTLREEESNESNQDCSHEEVNRLINGLQVLEVMAPSLDKSLLPPAIQCLPRLCHLLAHPYKAVRHMASRCIAVLASLDIAKTMVHVIHSVIPLLEMNGSEKISLTSNTLGSTKPNQVDSIRQGAAEALTCLVETLEVKVVPYAVLFMVPLLGRMSDQNQAVRLACSATFATLVQLLPLDQGSIADPPQLVEEKAQERKFLEQLLNPRSIPDTELPISVSTELRSYQQQGLNWLSFLNRYHLHGVLCDDMGLGKTLQALCILALDHHRNPQAPPSLVVCPPTLTGHWVYEAEKFFHVKDLSVIQYAGTPSEREKLRFWVQTYKLAVASYDIVRKDIEFFESLQWNYCVLDEGHVIKNCKTKSAKAAKRLHANHRLILSGTPVQNDVLELWSLFDFLMPGFLGTEKQFAAKYSRPILACREPKAGPKEQEAGALAMEALHRQVLPFLLRRNKEDVLQDLPPKITQDYYCDLSPLQRLLYEDFRVRHSATLASSTSSSGEPANKHGGHVFEALRYLRNVCNHPKLVLSPRHPKHQVVCNMLKQQQTALTDIEHGAKLPALKQLLLDCGIGQPQQQQARNASSSNVAADQQQQLVSQHRALIFCQLKAMLDIVENDLLKVHLPTVTYLRLDGSIPAAQRHSVVARFNADPSIDVLLLTTQVGGLGLNLTGADTVIFVEHDWNPMKDLQAMDRAHRIGQKKVVNVYRLITRATVEEKIMGLQKFKLLTANTIISPENASLETMATDQLLDLFSLDKEKEKKSDTHDEDSVSKVSGLTGVSRLVLDILPELWEQQQYDDEYDLDSFLSSLKPES